MLIIPWHFHMLLRFSYPNLDVIPLTVLYMPTEGTAQQGWVQCTKACIINYILRASIVSYHMIQGMCVCCNLHTVTQANDACTFPVAWPFLHVKFKQTCIKSAALHLEPVEHTYTKCYIMASCSNVLRNGHAEQLLQIQ